MNLFQLAPENAYVPRANREFLGKAARFAADQGIRQFVDLGAGLPSQGSTHEVARQVRPGARVVYVDSNPVVLIHARHRWPGTTPASRSSARTSGIPGGSSATPTCDG